MRTVQCMLAHGFRVQGSKFKVQGGRIFNFVLRTSYFVLRTFICLLPTAYCLLQLLLRTTLELHTFSINLCTSFIPIVYFRVFPPFARNFHIVDFSA
jgi:hypothetical protein